MPCHIVNGKAVCIECEGLIEKGLRSVEIVHIVAVDINAPNRF